MKIASKKAEVSLLLYFETRSVDHSGRVDSRYMNESDVEIAKKWNEIGFVRFGRIASEDCNANGSNWVELSDDAWSEVSVLRRERAKRNWKTRRFRSTEEKRQLSN
ncbi:hypothetical protein VN12_02135 [Pirellula sp. SH-Sr6A]|nr:hypothetical protein VN12_02135 [Pirellula sp. SH-Sr6A]